MQPGRARRSCVTGPYTRYPRSTMWLLREGDIMVGGLDADSEPVFEAEVRPFYLGKTPVTNEQYEVFRADHPRAPTSPDDDSPVVGVSFLDAVAYCGWYSEWTGREFRLPTEVEWEYACRGDTGGRTFYGERPIAAERFVWDSRNAGGRAQRVEQKRANPFGLHGTLGNVWEWTASLYLPYPVSAGDGRDDPAAPGPRVIRGGSFREDREAFATARRASSPPETGRDDLGFRIARSL